MEYVHEILEHLIPIAGTILAGVLGVLGAWVLRLIKRRTGMEISAGMSTMAMEFAVASVARAEQWAVAKVKNGEPRPGGADKLEVALVFFEGIAEEYNLPEMARDRVVELLESALGVPRLAAPDTERTALEFGPGVSEH